MRLMATLVGKEGDWNADGDFTSADLVVAFRDGGYERGPRRPVVTVPEPKTPLVLVVGFSAAFLVMRRVLKKYCSIFPLHAALMFSVAVTAASAQNYNVRQIVDLSTEFYFLDPSTTALMEYQGELYFVASDSQNDIHNKGLELFKTDGKSVVKFDLLEGPEGSFPNDLTVFGHSLFFTAQNTGRTRNLFRFAENEFQVVGSVNSLDHRFGPAPRPASSVP